MILPPAETALYNHPLPLIEDWLRGKGCVQDEQDPTRWWVEYDNWEAEILMDIEEIRVRYRQAATTSARAFPYSLSRKDVEDAIFTGP